MGQVDFVPQDEDAPPAGDGFDAFVGGLGDDWLQNEEALLEDIGEDAAVLRAVAESEGNVWVPDEDEEDFQLD